MWLVRWIKVAQSLPSKTLFSKNGDHVNAKSQDVEQTEGGVDCIRRASEIRVQKRGTLNLHWRSMCHHFEFDLKVV